MRVPYFYGAGRRFPPRANDAFATIFPVARRSMLPGWSGAPGGVPGGQVYVAADGPWGPHPFASQVITARWVTASRPTHDAASEAVGHTAGGTIGERFG